MMKYLLVVEIDDVMDHDPKRVKIALTKHLQDEFRPMMMRVQLFRKDTVWSSYWWHRRRFGAESANGLYRLRAGATFDNRDSGIEINY